MSHIASELFKTNGKNFKKAIRKKRLYNRMSSEITLDVLNLSNQKLQNNIKDFSWKVYNDILEQSQSAGWDFFSRDTSFGDFFDLIEDAIEYNVVEYETEGESSEEEY